jgi:ribosomal protein S18 acetylase RimI-like enzyme
MNIQIKYNCSDIDWNRVAEILQSVGMAHYSPETHKKAFEASYCTVFLFDDKTLIGFGRAISDGAYQAAVYDCAVIDAFQGQGLGRLMMQEILARLPECNVILYAAPGREGFYKKLGFRRMKTGMAVFRNSDAMTERGFTEK